MVEPSALKVPVNVKVIAPAPSVSVTSWLLIFPESAPDPLLHRDGGAFCTGRAMAYISWPVRDWPSCNTNPLKQSGGGWFSYSGVQLGPLLVELLCDVLVPQPVAKVMIGKTPNSEIQRTRLLIALFMADSRIPSLQKLHFTPNCKMRG